MKRIYQRLKITASLGTASRILLAFAFIFIMGMPAFSKELVFSNSSGIHGAAGQDNAVSLFRIVNSRVDSHWKFKSRSENNRTSNNINGPESFSYASGPIKLTSFTVKGVSNDKVMLNWNTSQEKNCSHFTIEKSFNRKDFSDAGIVFSIGDSEQPQQYSFIDKLRAGEKGIIYYRLKMVDMDGKSQRSPIKIVRIGQEKTGVSVRIYPNPEASKLSVALPANGHDLKSVDNLTQTGQARQKPLRSGHWPQLFIWVHSSTSGDSASHRI